MPTPDRIPIARKTYGAYESGDHSLVDTEILTFESGKIVPAEVYFRWELAPSPS